MTKKIKKILIFVSLLAVVFVAAHFVVAAGPDLGLDKAAGTGLSAVNDPRVIAANIIRIALGFLGIIAIGLIIYAGWLWMTAAGAEEKIEKAKKILIGAVIGLVIILSAFAIASFILSKLLGATTGGGDGTVCEPACASGQFCCNSSCSNSPCGGTPPGGESFNISSTVPRDLDTEVIRNVEIKVFFNKTIGESVKQEVLDNNFKVEKVAVIDKATKAETALPPVQAVGTVGLADGRRQINFKSNTACGDEKNTANCFEAWSKFKVTVNGNSGIISLNGQSLDCSVSFNCQFEFSTGEAIDTSGPEAGILPTQICRDDGNLSSIPEANLVNGWGRDDVGVADIRFCSEKQGGAENCFADSVKVGGLGQTYLSQSYKYDTSGYNVGDDYIFRVKASDVAGQVDKAEFSAKVRAGHCCNGVKDAEETNIDCGGECGACQGAACAGDMSAPAVCSDNLCASQFCATKNSAQSACEAAGYAAGTNSCCLCQRPPIITGLSPLGGFCADNDNQACLTDNDCGAGIKCDTSTPNGAAGNFFTVHGQYFGSAPGKVFASDGAGGWLQAKLANDAAVGNAQCGNQVWSDGQIIAIVPAGAKTGVIKVESLSGLDTTSDKTDLPDFKINNISRPGLCLLNPNHGKQDEVINYSGIKFSGVSPYFGNLENKVAGLAGNFTDKSGTAKVPNITAGRTTSFVLKDKTVSNFLNFTKDEEPSKGPFISSFEPPEGATGQYITINGHGFGGSKGASKVYFGAEGGAEANFDFPQICADSVWSDRQVIMKVPVGLTNGNYKITMKIGSWPAIDTSLIRPAVDFKADSALPLKPSLCKISPLVGQVNSQVNLYGEYFGQKDNDSQVRFQLNRDQTIFDFWNQDDNPKITGVRPDKIITTVPASAITGPVRVVKGSPELVGNGLNFTVGVCQESAECGADNLCCSAGTPYVGQCKAGATEQAACFPQIKACVYEWNFSTAGLSTCSQDQTSCGSSCCNAGQICEPAGNDGYGQCGSIECLASRTCGDTCCQSSCVDGVCPDQCEAGQVKCNIPNASADGPQFNCCNSGQCNQSTGQCDSCPANKPNQCGNDDCCSNVSNCKDADNNPATPTECADPESCAGYVNQCGDSPLCPNSPGKCSLNDGGQQVDTDVKCDDEACNELGRCKDKDGNNLCSYNSNLNKCVKINSSCDLTKKIKDINDIEVKLKCGAVDGRTVWHYNSRQTCVAGYTKSIDKNKCLGAVCEICSVGFICEQGASGGICVSDINICPSGASCVDGKCFKTTVAGCQCCCNKKENTAAGSNPACCTGLSCQASCGAGGNFGLCSGCTVVGNQAASNAKCNCAGTSGKFCDMSGDGGLGVCLDCAALTNGRECSSQGVAVCCVDAENKNACRGGQSFDYYQEVYREDFNSDNNFAGWEPSAECEDQYSVKEGNLQFQSKNGQSCNLDIKYRNFNFIAGKIYKIKIKIKTDDKTGYLDLRFTRGLKDYLASSKINSLGDEYEFILDDNNYTSIDVADYSLISLIRDGNLNFVWHYKIDYIIIEQLSNYAYCAYYECQTTATSAACNGPVASSTSPTYKTQTDCSDKCQAPPQFEQQCTSLGAANGPETAQDSCDISQCANFSCLNEDGSGPTPPNSCGICCCDPKVQSQCAAINPKLSCYANKGECSGANRGLCCGCSQDSDCGSPEATGCGASDARCCQARPSVTDVAPAAGAAKVCRNSLIKAVFNQAMNINTFKINIAVVGNYGLSPCPAGTQYLTAAYQPTIFARLKFWLSKMPLVNKIFATEVRALTGNFCSVAGRVSGIVKTGSDGQETTDLEFQPQKALEASRQYYVIIKGDADITDAVNNGVLSSDGIGMKADGYNSENPVVFNGLSFNNAKVWSFTTMAKNEVNEGICPLDRVEVKPSSHVFQTNENDTRDDDKNNKDIFNTIADSDLVFKAQAYAKNGQLLTATEEYNWTWQWESANDKIATAEQLAEPEQFKALVRAQEKVVDDQTEIRATASLADTTITKQGKAEVYVFLCKNIWPPLTTDADRNSSWAPWRDRSDNCTVEANDCKQTNFVLYYCRDAGAVGTVDDLPAIMSGSTVIRGQENDILKEFYFFREDLPKVTGISLATTTNDEIKQGGRAGLVWQAVAQAKKYTIYYGKVATNLTQSITVTTNGTETAPAIISDLTNGVKYYFAVTATYDTGAESDYSNKTTAIPADIWPPTAPIISALIAKGNKVEVVWEDQSQADAKRFKLFYGADNNAFGSSINIGYNSRGTTTVSNLGNGVTYYFGLVAYDFSNNASAISTIRSIAAGIDLSPITNNIVKQGGKAALKWNKFSPPDGQAINQYIIKYGLEVNLLSMSVSTGTLPTAFNPQIISDLVNEVKYYFAVKAVYNSGEESAYSNVISVTPADIWSPQTPAGFVGLANETGTADLSWEANNDDTAVYKIYYGATSGSLGDSVRLAKDKCANGKCGLTINKLNSETTYYFAISVLDGYNNESESSKEISLIIK